MDYQDDLKRYYTRNNLHQHKDTPIQDIFGRGVGKLSGGRTLDKEGLHFGIEVEVEGIRPEAREGASKLIMEEKLLWSMTDDNSLRNNGVEFVSHPLRLMDVEPQLKLLYSTFPAKADFARRAGIHIHSNVGDLTYGKYVALIYLYSMIEHALFYTVADHRRNNIYCVPLYRSQSYVSALRMQKGVPTVGKYAALNILPIRQYGTVEFRHFESTGDVGKIMRWVGVIADLQRYVRQNVDDYILWQDTVLNLRTTSEFIEFLRGVLSDDSFEFLYGETTALEQMEVEINRALSQIAADLSAEPLAITNILSQYV